MKTLAEQNAALLHAESATLLGRHRGRLVLTRNGTKITWWMCNHSHENAAAAARCALAAHKEIRAGVNTHRLKGRA